MPRVMRLPAVLGAVLVLCGCASTVKPAQGRGVVDSPLTSSPNRVACLRAAHLPVHVVGRSTLQIGAPPASARVTFEPTAGGAEQLQLEGTRWVQGAEVIGAALLFPGGEPGSQLTAIENCLDAGVKEPKY